MFNICVIDAEEEQLQIENKLKEEKKAAKLAQQKKREERKAKEKLAKTNKVENMHRELCFISDQITK